MRYTLLACTWLLLITVSLSAAPRPNILYFYVDDLGWGSIGPNGQAKRRAANKPWVKTPNLDKLAAGGINFARGYGATVCSPARSSQQTGFHQGHTFADRNDPNNAKKAMRADDICMGEALAAAGYTTGYWGKWGYGGSKDKANPVIDNVQTLPTSHGYKHVLAELHHVRAHTFFQPTLWHAPAKAGAKGAIELVPNTMKPFVNNAKYPAQPSNHSHPDYPSTAYCDDPYAFAALDFVRQGAKNYNKTKTPFFGLLAVQIPHAPFHEIAKLPDWDKAYADDPHFPKLAAQSRQWAAMVTRIDAHFGNILAALEDPNGDGDKSDSVASNTLVIFQSDNGGPGGSSCKEFDANGGLKGNKGSIHEGGIRVPTIMRWPSRITADSKLKAGTTSNMVIDVSDLLPTLCELAGATPPLGLDGVSLAPTLMGTGQQRTREYLIHEAGANASIIRGKYKLIMNRGGKSGKSGKAQKGGKKKKESAAPTGVSLFDLEADHSESKNIAADHPELVKELQALLIAEHVKEPAGFANTYHNWTGADGAEVASADNWSDYVYENAGETYMTDNGAPRSSWTARMAKSGKAVAKTNVEFLGLEMGGGQQLEVQAGATVTGRNEVRVSKGGVLNLAGGTAASLRWLDVLPGGTLQGSGTVVGSLYSSGTVTAAGTLKVTGTAHLGGTLSVSAVPPNKTVLTAAKIQGTFANDQVTVNGAKFKITYSNTAVTLVAQ